VATVSYMSASSPVVLSEEDEEETEGRAGDERHIVALRLWNPSSGALSAETLVVMPEEPDVGASFILGTEANLVSRDAKTGTLSLRSFDMRKATMGEAARDGEGAKLPLPASTAKAECAATRTALFCLDVGRRLLYHAALPVSSASGNSFAAVGLASLGAPDTAAPVALRAVPGTKNKAEVILRTAEGGENVLILVAEGGKMKSTDLVAPKEKKAALLVTGCKNSDDVLHVSQVELKRKHLHCSLLSLLLFAGMQRREMPFLLFQRARDPLWQQRLNARRPGHVSLPCGQGGELVGVVRRRQPLPRHPAYGRGYDAGSRVQRRSGLDERRILGLNRVRFNYRPQ